MGLLDPQYTDAERVELDKLQSRINVARAVLQARLDQGLTQEELGRAAGTKQSRISDLEGLKGNPRFDTLDRVARVLGLMIALIPRSEPAAQVKPISALSYGILTQGFSDVGVMMVAGTEGRAQNFPKVEAA